MEEKGEEGGRERKGDSNYGVILYFKQKKDAGF